MPATSKVVTNERTAEVMLGFARRGYARALQAAHGHLWCPSCDTDFDSHDLTVEETVATSAGPGGSQATVYALRCSTCGAGGIWVVRHPLSDDDVRLVEWVDSLSDPSGNGDIPPRHCQNFVSA